MIPGAWRARSWAADQFAARLLAGPWTLDGIAAAVWADNPSLPARSRAALTVWVFALGEETYPPPPQSLKRHLIASPHFKPKREPLAAAVLDPPRFAPAHNFADLPIPRLATIGALAEWLGETPEQLDWLTDERRTNRHATLPALRHYHYAFVRKRDGGQRLLEAPKTRLKAIQRRILREILAPIPVHDRAHGFVPGRSCLTGAQVHAASCVVATFDLSQFFTAMGSPRIHGLFRSLGYPWAVARRLAGLCTTITPSSVVCRLPPEQRPAHAVPHLPQGAPTSPALANLLAWTLDVRLQGLARAAGATYTRYADDLAFSGDADFAPSLRRFGKAVGTIVREEGFALNAAKSRIMPASGCQRVTGIVVNDHCNIRRADFDRLKAILHNCVRIGPASQNRGQVADFRRHLDGRIVWVEQVNRQRGEKLRRLFERISWESKEDLF